MAFTMHSHSGQFCPGHAKDDLETIVQHAIRSGLVAIGLTEHMPRLAQEDLYPEELGHSPAASLTALLPRHESYLATATALRAKYASRIRILIGLESEWLRPGEYVPFIRGLSSDPRVDYLVGSVHHVLGVPIDYDSAFYAKACDAAVAAAAGASTATDATTGAAAASAADAFAADASAADASAADAASAENTADARERALYNAYYAAQADMLSALRPRVVGHLDVIRLLSRDPARDVRARWPETWAQILTNLRLAGESGALLECNSSALRKGLAEPYPARPIAEAWLAVGGRFTISDDSHGVAQVATNYGRMVDYLESLGVREVWTFEKVDEELVERSVGLQAVRESLRT